MKWLNTKVPRPNRVKSEKSVIKGQTKINSFLINKTNIIGNEERSANRGHQNYINCKSQVQMKVLEKNKTKMQYKAKLSQNQGLKVNLLDKEFDLNETQCTTEEGSLRTADLKPNQLQNQAKTHPGRRN